MFDQEMNYTIDENSQEYEASKINIFDNAHERYINDAQSNDSTTANNLVHEKEVLSSLDISSKFIENANNSQSYRVFQIKPLNITPENEDLTPENTTKYK